MIKDEEESDLGKSKPIISDFFQSRASLHKPPNRQLKEQCIWRKIVSILRQLKEIIRNFPRTSGI